MKTVKANEIVIFCEFISQKQLYSFSVYIFENGLVFVQGTKKNNSYFIDSMNSLEAIEEASGYSVVKVKKVSEKTFPLLEIVRAWGESFEMFCLSTNDPCLEKIQDLIKKAA